MVTHDRSNVSEEISLLDSLDGEWIKLPTAAVLDVGPAAQTLGGLLKLDPKETFRAIEANAQAACVPLTTCKRHRVVLAKGGWIINTGRQKTPAGTRKRRTCTIEITAKTNVAKREYLFLPWWACCRIEQLGRLTWATKVLLAVVMSRLASLKATIERQDGTKHDADEFWASLEKLGGEEQFRFSLDRLERDTGLVTGTYECKDRRTWAEFRKDYETKIAARFEVLSRTAARQSLDAFERVAKPKLVAAITADVVDKFTTDRMRDAGIMGRKVSPATVNRDLRYIRLVLNIAHEWGLIARVPRIRFLKQPQKLPTYMPSDHFAAIYTACNVAQEPSEVPNVATAEWCEPCWSRPT